MRAPTKHLGHLRRPNHRKTDKELATETIPVVMQAEMKTSPPGPRQPISPTQATIQTPRIPTTVTQRRMVLAAIMDGMAVLG